MSKLGFTLSFLLLRQIVFTVLAITNCASINIFVLIFWNTCAKDLPGRHVGSGPLGLGYTHLVFY